MKSESNKPKIIITVEGGIVQGVMANTEVDVVILDYDTEGFDEDKVREVPAFEAGKVETAAGVKSDVDTKSEWSKRMLAAAFGCLNLVTTGLWRLPS